MCGIVGFAGPGGEPALAAMVEALVHRGPDAAGRWSDPERPLHLGHRRLAILDMAGGGQPMWTACGRFGIVFNGEIYNHLELRAELVRLGHRFVTDHSDTEVLLHGYREWGEGLAVRLNGMWAFALLDREAGTLFLSRDRFGEKPLYYTRQGPLFAFASELSALLRHPGLRAELSPLAVQKLFALGFIPAPHSICRDIFKLPAGCNLTFDLAHGHCRVSRYWAFVLAPEEPVSKRPEEEYAEEIRRLLSESVRMRLMADVPVGILLSGGVDSSAVAYFAALHSTTPVRTFCIGFDEPSFDESAHARKVAERLGTRHVVDRLSIEKSLEILPEALSRLDEPMADSSLLPCFLLFRHVRRHVTVALGGDGSDELFAGYDTFRALAWAERYHRLVPPALHHPVRFLAGLLPLSHRNMSLDFKIKRTLRGLSSPPALWNSAWLGPLAPDELGELIRAPVDIEEVYAEPLAAWRDCPQESVLDRTLQFYTRLYLQDDILTKLDRSSMMHSVECRVPFLDNHLVEFVRRMPSRFKLRRGTTKYILKKALAPVLPPEVLHRPKKGFGVPVGAWMAARRLPVESAADADALLDPGAVRTRIDQHLGLRADHRAFLWTRLVLQYFLAGRRRPA